MVDELIESMKTFVENPSVENAMEMVSSKEVPGIKIIMCYKLVGPAGFCRECAWNPICYVHEVDPSSITDEMISVMVLEAMRRLAMYETEHD